MKAEIKNTPWVYLLIGTKEIGFTISFYDQRKDNVFNVRIFESKELALAIANLIATAPELLKASKAFLNPEVMIEEKIIIAKKAIAKAEGR